MPAPLDLTGRRFGKLLVLRADGKIQFGRPMTAWLCRCDCGNEERIPQNRLPHSPYIEANNPRHVVLACSTCRYTRVCEECGVTFVSKQARATCSDACEIVHRRAVELRSYYNQKAADPDLNRKRWRRAVERMASDEAKRRAFDERMAATKQRSVARRNADPEKRRAFLEWQRAYYAARATEILAKRRERLAARLAAMTPEERAAYDARIREYSRRWREEERAEIYADPQRHTAFIHEMREYRREIAARKALAELLSTASDLESRTRK